MLIDQVKRSIMLEAQEKKKINDQVAQECEKIKRGWSECRRSDL